MLRIILNNTELFLIPNITNTQIHTLTAYPEIDQLRVYPLLGNDSVNTFPPKKTRLTIVRLLLGNGLVNAPP
jgi:hypothetical protein